MNVVNVASWMEARIGQCPDGQNTFFNPESFPWVRTVEANWATIGRELEKLLEHKEDIPNLQDVSPEQSAVAHGESWKSFFLYGFGHKIDQNCAQCPETTRIVRKIPGLKMAMFSILAPRSRIPSHRGPYKGLLRFHLGLIIPSPSSSCGIRVGNEMRCWQEGRSLIFDDSHDHEAWNHSDSHRVILFVDFVRPLPFPLSILNHLMIWQISRLPFVMNAVNRLRARKDPSGNGARVAPKGMSV